MEHRAKLIDIAAFLDRLERTADVEAGAPLKGGRPPQKGPLKGADKAKAAKAPCLWGLSDRCALYAMPYCAPCSLSWIP